MAKKLQFKRLIALTFFMALAFGGLGYRLVDLQVLRHGELAREARSNTQFVCRLEPRRGDILDCKGNLLATSVFVKTVCADPSLIGTHAAEVAHALAPLLQMNEGELERRLVPRSRRNEKGQLVPVRYVLLKRKVSTDTWEKIQDAMSKLPLGEDAQKLPKKELAFNAALRKSAIMTEPVDDQLRIYPNSSLAANVIGYVGEMELTNMNPPIQTLAGLDGIEWRFDSKLKGVRGWRVSEHDGHQREMVDMREQDIAPHDGLNVVLTIDSVIQNIVENALRDGLKEHEPKSISGIVIRPRTGEILAMASLPTFDPNNPGAPGTPPDALHNRLISDVAEPGSTFKIVVVSGALNDGIVKLTDEFDCEHGKFYYGGTLLHDHTTTLGVLSVKEIITKSSNIGAAKIGLKMGDVRLHDYITAFGFGRTTGIPLKAESRGIVRAVTNWSKLSITRIPMGQEVGTTCLQMAMAMSAIANKGVLMQPMIVDRLVDTDGSTAIKYYPQVVRRVVSEEADKDMVEALKSVVTDDGTAKKAAMEHYTVAGKTGTAQKAEFTFDGKKYHGHYGEKFYSSFIGFFPADNPEILIYVALDTPKGNHYGGETAAPIFKQIAEQAANYLNIVPDKDNPSEAPGAPAVPVAAPVVAPDQPIKTAEAKLP
ncbi:MAG TPA: penicillin-binding protein 2 [Verrucomicrobiae bacterium]|nr:penicillin-binding protein 2 [Verrucomicrobiae bacterium]